MIEVGLDEEGGEEKKAAEADEAGGSGAKEDGSGEADEPRQKDEGPPSTPTTGHRQPNPTAAAGPSPSPSLLIGKEHRAHLEGSERAAAVLAAMDELLSQVQLKGQVRSSLHSSGAHFLPFFQVQQSACTCTALAQITIK